MRFIVLTGLIVALAVAPAAARTRDPSGARAFIERIYADYPRDTPRSDEEYYGLFAPELAELIRQNDNYAPGDVGPLDGDPICQCQDDAGLRHRILSLAAAGDAASVVVRNSFDDPAHPRADLLTYRLVRIGGAWRIDDIGTDEQPTRQAALNPVRNSRSWYDFGRASR